MFFPPLSSIRSVTGYESYPSLRYSVTTRGQGSATGCTVTTTLSSTQTTPRSGAGAALCSRHPRPGQASNENGIICKNLTKIDRSETLINLGVNYKELFFFVVVFCSVIPKCFDLFYF